MAAKKNALCSKVADGWHPNGRGSRQWTGTELDGHRIKPRTRTDLPPTFFDGHVSCSSKIEFECVCFFDTSEVVSRIFLPSTQPNFEICFPWCLTHSDSLGRSVDSPAVLDTIEAVKTQPKKKNTLFNTVKRWVVQVLNHSLLS